LNLFQNWKEEYGGHFELWDKKMEACQKKILPLFNTMAIFSTTDFSYHGHPDKLKCPENRSRKSLALYYYSNGRPAHQINHDIKEHSTLFKARPENVEDKKAFSKKISIEVAKQFAIDCVPPILIKGFRTLIK